jgi:hypothetical protein
MRAVGIATTVVGGVVLVVGAVLVARSAGDVKRYIKIRKM